MRVKVYKGNLTKAMMILNRRLREDGDFQRSIQRARYEKPSDKRRRKAKESKRRVFKERITEVKQAEGLHFDGKGIGRTSTR